LEGGEGGGRLLHRDLRHHRLDFSSLGVRRLELLVRVRVRVRLRLRVRL